MPANFAEVWLDRVINNLTTADQAPFLDGIAEMDVDVSQMGEGTITESNVIHVPTSEFAPDILINNTTYPLALQAYTDDAVIIQLDKYQTKVVTLSDDQVLGASYDRIDNATRKTVQKLTSEKFGKAVHAIAPTSTAANTPVITATGGATAEAAPGGRLRLVYEDLVSLKEAFDAIDGCPVEGRRLVLNSNHYNDLLISHKAIQKDEKQLELLTPVIDNKQKLSQLSANLILFNFIQEQLAFYLEKIEYADF